jgi:hypothetical protein
MVCSLATSLVCSALMGCRFCDVGAASVGCTKHKWMSKYQLRDTSGPKPRAESKMWYQSDVRA